MWHLITECALCPFSLFLFVLAIVVVGSSNGLSEFRVIPLKLKWLENYDFILFLFF